MKTWGRLQCEAIKMEINVAGKEMSVCGTVTEQIIALSQTNTRAIAYHADETHTVRTTAVFVDLMASNFTIPHSFHHDLRKN